MPEPFISFKLRNLDKVQAFLKKLPRGTVKVALDAIVIYLIGDDSHGLRHYPSYKYVTRESAYGQTFVSDRQRRKVMAMIRSGEIMPGKPNRSGDAAKGYMYTETAGGYGRTIQNADTGAYYTQDDQGQARQPALVGWRRISQNIADNMAGALRSANAAVAKWLNR